MIKKHNFIFRVLLLVCTGLALWCIPAPEGVDTKAWHLLAIFIVTILTVILDVMPMGAITLIALTAATMTKTLTFSKAFGGFSDPIVWLILGALILSHGFIQTGLGNRITYAVLSVLGRSLLGVMYGIGFAELILAMYIPSVTARSGGIIYPIVKGLINAVGNPSAHKDSSPINSYFVSSAYQITVITSAMFLTAMAGNPLIVESASKAGITITWLTWAMAAFLPGVVSLLVVPYFLLKYFKPKFEDKEVVLTLAKENLQKLGSPSRDEIVMLSIFILLLFLWLVEPFGMTATVSVLFGISLMLLFNIIRWKDLIGLSAAWDTFIWMGALISLVNGLGEMGLTTWFSNYIAGYLSGMSLVLALGGLFLIYFYSHYFFASSTAHIGAMFLPFLLVALGLGASPTVTVLMFAFASNLYGGLTHYGLGPAPIWYGTGYMSMSSWWKVGFYVSVLNIFIWLSIGSFWWKWLGLY